MAVVKLIGAIFKIPLTNIIGAEGMTHFNTSYKIYNLLLTISTAGSAGLQPPGVRGQRHGPEMRSGGSSMWRWGFSSCWACPAR